MRRICVIGWILQNGIGLECWWRNVWSCALLDGICSIWLLWLHFCCFLCQTHSQLCYFRLVLLFFKVDSCISDAPIPHSLFSMMLHTSWPFISLFDCLFQPTLQNGAEFCHQRIPSIFEIRLHVMIEGFVQLQKVTQYSSSWRNCWLRIDDSNIHLFYRANCPARCVKANRVGYSSRDCCFRWLLCPTVKMWNPTTTVMLERLGLSLS